MDERYYPKKYYDRPTEEQPRGIPLRERLMQEREGALKQVARIDRALALLENNKDTEELINLLGGIY
jgi:hypothetical protein